MATYLSAREAAAELGVSLPTLYAYVSRGQIRSEREGAARQRRYLAEDVWLLNARKRGRRDPAGAAQDALHWGMPVLESRLSVDHFLATPSTNPETSSHGNYVLFESGGTIYLRYEGPQ